jgi:hypothetical protein
MNNYDFRTWLNPDGSDTPALSRLKEWIGVENFSMADNGILRYSSPFSKWVNFPPTLLPYFFDEQGIVGWVAPHGEDWVTSVVADVHRGVFRPSRFEADWTNWNRMKDILNDRLNSQPTGRE